MLHQSDSTVDRRAVASFADRLATAVREKKNAVCVGLDPRAAQLPKTFQALASGHVESIAQAYQQFCCEIIDVVAPLVPVVKPQAAFFERLGPAGMVALGTVIRYASDHGLMVILDGKRNDIGTTAQAYAEAYLGPATLSPWGADALTVSPYLGEDSLEPFIERCQFASAGIFVLVKTSNPGSGQLQDLVVEQKSIAERVADWVESQSYSLRSASGYGPVGAVVGATYPEELARMRERMPSAWILIPGYGAQGGAARDVAAGFDHQGLGALVNSSRGIIFAHASDRYRSLDRWQTAVESATREMIAELDAAIPQLNSAARET